MDSTYIHRFSLRLILSKMYQNNVCSIGRMMDTSEVHLTDNELKWVLPSTVHADSDTVAYDAMLNYELFNHRLTARPLEHKEFIHQELQERFYSNKQPNDRALIYHGIGSGKCVHPFTRIQVDGFMVPIQDVWKYVSITSNAIDDPETPGAQWWILKNKLDVRCYDPKASKDTYSSVYAVYRQYVEESLVQIEFQSGRRVTITQAHRLAKIVNQSTKTIVWTNILRPGDLILTDQVKSGSLDTISTVTLSGYHGYVYDLEVDEYHNYYIDGILGHNTCTSVLIHENFKRRPLSGTFEYPALVIVPNKDVAVQYESEIVNSCTHGVYAVKKTSTDDPDGDVSIGKIKRDHTMAYIRKAIRMSYEVVTMEKFAKDVSKLPIHEIRKRYNQRDIIVDEAHRLQETTKEGQPNMYASIYRFVTAFDPDPEFTGPLSIRLFLLTGTPIWDKPYELASLFNLVIKPEDRFKKPKSTFMKQFMNLKTMTLNPDKREDFKRRVRGYMSYLRTDLSDTKVTYEGIKAPLSHYYPVVPCVMSKFQSKIVKKLWTPESKTTAVDKNTLLHGPQEASTFVFPDKSYGSEGFKKHIRLMGVRRKGGPKKLGSHPWYEYMSKDTITDIYNHLDEYSSKFHKIVQDLLANPNEVGVVFLDTVTTGGGVVNLGLILNESPEFTLVYKASQIAQPRKPNEPRRVVMFTSKDGTTHDTNEIRRMLSIINSPENKYGDYCSVIIMSKKVSTGINIYNTRRFYQKPYWNMSLLRQSSGRVKRARGHEAFPVNERYIKEYTLVSVYAGDESVKGYSGFSTTKTIDTYIHGIAERKDRASAELLRAAIESSWDCALAYNRNVHRMSSDGSPECLYAECNYECDNYPKKYINKSGRVWTYTINPNEARFGNFFEDYALDDMKDLLDEIKDLFRHYTSLPFDIILALLGKKHGLYDYKLLKCLGYMIDTRDVVYNRHGFACVLKEASDVYYLVRIHSDAKKAIDSSSADRSLVVSRTSLEDILQRDMYKSDNEKIKAIFSKGVTLESLNELYFDSILTVVEIGIAEFDQGPVFMKLLPNHIKHRNSVWYHNLKTMAEPYIGRGIPALKFFDAKETGYRMLPDNQESRLWTPVDPDSIGSVKKMFVSDRKAATFKGKDKGKRKTTEARQVGDITRDEVPGGVFGFYDDGKFSIREIEQPGERKRKGARCMEVGWTKNRLVGLYGHVGYFPKLKKDPSVPTGTEDLKAALDVILGTKFKHYIDTTSLSRDQLTSLVTLYNMKKGDICSMLSTWMEDHQLVITV